MKIKINKNKGILIALFLILITLVLAIVFLIMGSGEKRDSVIDSVEIVNSETNDVEEYEEEYLDMNNQEIPEKGLRKKTTSTSYFSEEVFYRVDGKIEKTVDIYRYGKSPSVYEKTYIYKENGQIEKSIEIENVVEDELKNLNNTIERHYKYLPDGKLDEVFLNDDSGAKDFVISYSYNQDGRLVGEITSSSQRASYMDNYRLIYEYAEDGKIIRKSGHYWESGYDIKYEYSSDGRLIKEVATSNGLGEGYCVEYLYSNDKVDKAIRYVWRCDVYSDKSSETAYTYRADGRLERKVEYTLRASWDTEWDNEGEEVILKTITYEYYQDDVNDNLGEVLYKDTEYGLRGGKFYKLKETFYRSDGAIDKEIQYNAAVYDALKFNPEDVQNERVYYYNSDGDIQKTTSVNWGPIKGVSKNFETIYAYMPDGKLESRTTHNPPLVGELWDETRYEYTADGKLSREINRGWEWGGETTYQYDSDGRKFVVTEHSGSTGGESVVIEVYSYNLDGSVSNVHISVEPEEEGLPQPDTNIVYQYKPNGALDKKIKYDESGAKIGETIYEYRQ